MRVVIGYVPRVDRLPSELRKLGLTQRVAFVLDSFRSDKVDMYFDEELYASLMAAVREASSADRMFYASASGEAFEIGDAMDVNRLLARQPEGEREPLSRVIVVRERTTAAVIGSEPWAHCGGPEPYHDSYTVPIYSREDMAERLEAAARNVCQRLGVELATVLRASETPVPPGTLARLKSLFGLPG